MSVLDQFNRHLPSAKRGDRANARSRKALPRIEPLEGRRNCPTAIATSPIGHNRFAVPNKLREIHLNSSQDRHLLGALLRGRGRASPPLRTSDPRAGQRPFRRVVGGRVPRGELGPALQSEGGEAGAAGQRDDGCRRELLIESNEPVGASSGVFYATADLGHRVQLGVDHRADPGPFVTVNELTTVAAGYAMAQFTGTVAIGGPDFGLRIAAGMNDNLVSPATGESSEVRLASPNGDQTNSLRSTRALANLLALYVRNGGRGSGPCSRGHAPARSTSRRASSRPCRTSTGIPSRTSRLSSR